MKTRFLSFLLIIAYCILSNEIYAQALIQASPGQVGMNAEQFKYADQIIQEAIKNKEIPGAVLAVVRHDKMAYLKAYGNKCLEPKIEPMTVNTVFDLASCSKSVSTALSAMILIERGRLRLEDPVQLFIPEFKNWADSCGNKKTIRVVDLLTHTSGLPSYAPLSEVQRQYGILNSQGLMTYIASCKRDFEPETRFQYSCLNYITLQHIIEKLTQQSLREFAMQNIFRVLGMRHTDYLPVKQDDAGQWVNSTACSWMELIAPTERQENGQILCGQVHDPLARVMNGGISGNAGLFSNANDLAILAAALLNGGEHNGHRILSPLGVSTMTSVPKDLMQFGRTLGWDAYSPYSSNKGNLLSDKAFGHTGYTGTSIVIDPKNDIAIILLVNAVHPKDGKSVVRLRALISNIISAAILK